MVHATISDFVVHRESVPIDIFEDCARADGPIARASFSDGS